MPWNIFFGIEIDEKVFSRDKNKFKIETITDCNHLRVSHVKDIYT